MCKILLNSLLASVFLMGNQGYANIKSSNIGLVQQRTEVVKEYTLKRVSLDVGSGQTKVMVADVNPATNKITKIWKQYAVEVPLQKEIGNARGYETIQTC